MAQRIYRNTMIPSRPGAPYGVGAKDDLSLINDVPRTAQVTTVTIGTVTNSATYTLSINGFTISYTADSSTADTEINAGLIAAINADTNVNGDVVAATTAATTFTITALIAGMAFTFAEADAKLTSAATTADDDADPIPFGALVLGVTGQDKQGQRAAAGALTTQVVTLTPTAVNSTNYVVEVVVNGVIYPGVYVSDGSAIAQEIVEGIVADLNAQLPTESVVATEDNAVVVLTSELAGQTFSLGTLTDFAETSDTADTDPLTDINRAARGIALAVDTYEQANDTEEAAYAANSIMSVRRLGPVVVEVESAITWKSPVYVRVSGTGDTAKFAGAKGAGLVRLTGAKFLKNLGSGLAVLQANF